MGWAGMVDEMLLLVLWLKGSVNSEAYPEKVLKVTVWPAVKVLLSNANTGTNRMVPAATYVTVPCLHFLVPKFRDRVISRNTEHRWPLYSPDLSPVTFYF